MTRRIKYPKHLREPRATVPHPCVVLAIDPGKSTGWAIFSRSRVVSFGACDPFVGIEFPGVCAEAVAIASEAGLPLVCAHEGWNAGGWGSHQTLVGLGASWGACRASLHEAGITKRRMVRVVPATWQSVVFGGRPDDTKAEARKVASAIVGENVGGDAADAICIGAWAICSPDVWHALKKSERPKGEYAEEIERICALRREFAANQPPVTANKIVAIEHKRVR